jgi:hypothetical protein
VENESDLVVVNLLGKRFGPYQSHESPTLVARTAPATRWPSLTICTGQGCIAAPAVILREESLTSTVQRWSWPGAEPTATAAGVGVDSPVVPGR